MDHYSVLGVEHGAGQEELKQAYHARAQVLHPDRHQDAPSHVRDEAQRGMAQLNEAWRVLGNPESRQRYDLIRNVDLRTHGSEEQQPEGRPPRANECLMCGSTPVAEVDLRAETGKLLWRTTRQLDGPMCRHCGIAIFRMFTSRTLLTGWWGVISFFTNFLTIMRNIVGRRRIGQLQPPARTPGVVGLASNPLDPGPSVFQRPGTYVGPLLLAIAISIAVPTYTSTPRIAPLDEPTVDVGADCVTMENDLLMGFVSCDKPNDGRVVGVRIHEAQCPLHTDLYFGSESQAKVVCVDTEPG